MAHDNDKRTLKYDWGDLFERWVKSGQPKNEFLKKNGIPPDGMIAKKKTSTWHDDLRNTANVLRRTNKDDQIDKALAAAELQQQPPPSTVIKEIWQIVQQWRQKQAENDYRLADIIRLHCKVLLKNSMITKLDIHGKETVYSTLRPNELLSIARVTETIQKIQRLALGLSTENIGVDSGITIQENIPIFEVQVNDNGKFVNVR